MRLSFMRGVDGAAVGGGAVLVVLDAGGQVGAAQHAGVADGADVVLGLLEALVVLQLRAGGARGARSMVNWLVSIGSRVSLRWAISWSERMSTGVW